MEQEQESLGPVIYWINTKLRRVGVTRGEEAAKDKLARGFKQATAAHFLRYTEQSQRGFRKAKKAARK